GLRAPSGAARTPPAGPVFPVALPLDLRIESELRQRVDVGAVRVFRARRDEPPHACLRLGRQRQVKLPIDATRDREWIVHELQIADVHEPLRGHTAAVTDLEAAPDVAG